MLDIITLTLDNTLLISGQLWFVLALIAYQWVDYGKIVDFFLSTGGSLVDARHEQMRRKGTAKNATVSVDLKNVTNCNDEDSTSV